MKQINEKKIRESIELLHENSTDDTLIINSALFTLEMLLGCLEDIEE